MPVSPIRVVIDGTIVLDASLSERHDLVALITEHPVEVGSDIADNIRLKPDGLQLDGLFTNTPLSRIERQNRGSMAPMDRGFAQESADQLRALHKARRRVQVATELRVYEDMVLTTLSIPRDPKTGDAVRFSATFTEIRFAVNEQVVLEQVTRRPADTTKPTKKEKQGKKTGQEVESSALITFTDSLGLTTSGQGLNP